MASDNGHIFTASTDVTIDGNTWKSTSYEIASGSLPTGPQFRRGLYVETLGLQVRVGAAGLIATSPDNLNWTVQTSGTSKNCMISIGMEVS